MTQFGPKIYNWRDTQLSIARHYGGIKIQGIHYTVDTTDPDMPLIAPGVKTYEQDRKAEQAAINQADKAKAVEAQGPLL